MNAIDSVATGTYGRQSATLLSQQPATPPKKKKIQKEPGYWARVYQHLETRLAGLRIWRYSWWIHWQQLAQYYLPRRYIWLVVPNRTWKGQQLNTSIIDGTATLAMQICAGGLWSGLTNPSRPWFVYGPAIKDADLDQDGKQWFADTTHIMEEILQGSNFYSSTAQMFQDEVVFGTSPMIIYEDSEDVIRCYLPCAGEYYLGAGSRLKDNVFAREFTYSVAQIVEMFQLVNCPPEVQKAWQEGGGSLQTEFVVAHMIEPNSPISSRSGGADIYPVPKQFTFREFYWLRGQKDMKELSRRGFHKLPVPIARWTIVANDAYGRGPGMDALGDTKQLQLATIRQAEFMDKLVRPPMIGDVRMKNEPSSIRSGDITYVDTTGSNAAFKPAFEVHPQALAPLTQAIEKIASRIRDTFFVNIFMAITQMAGVQPRNELELTKRDLERLQVLGPMIHLFETEFASVALERVFDIAERRGLIRPKPPSLQNMAVKITYISILHLALRAAQSVSLSSAMKFGAGLSEAAKAAGLQDPLRIIDLDEAMREIMEMANVDPRLVFSKAQVAKADQVRAQQTAAQHALAATPPMVDAAQTLSQTPLGGDSALAAMLGHAGGGGAVGGPTGVG